MTRPLTLVVLVLLAAGAVVLAARAFAPTTFSDPTAFARLIYLLGFLALIGGGLVASRHLRLGQATMQLTAWGLIIAAVAGAGVLTREARLDRAAAPRAVAGEPSSVSVRKAPDGHFWVTGDVNGVAVRFLVDTGASSVALTRADAARIGLNVADLRYTAPVQTANGAAFAAPARIDSLSVGGLSERSVRALVLQQDGGVSLLGMSYLSRLSSVEARRDELILRR